MMRKFWTSIALGAAVLSASAAHAQRDEHRGPPHRRGEERMFQMQRQEPPVSQPMPMRESHPHGRMSPEERRQLRRDIDAAGRELYQPPSRQRH